MDQVSRSKMGADVDRVIGGAGEVISDVIHRNEEILNGLKRYISEQGMDFSKVSITNYGNSTGTLKYNYNGKPMEVELNKLKPPRAGIKVSPTPAAPTPVSPGPAPSSGQSPTSVFADPDGPAPTPDYGPRKTVSFNNPAPSPVQSVGKPADDIPKKFNRNDVRASSPGTRPSIPQAAEVAAPQPARKITAAVAEGEKVVAKEGQAAAKVTKSAAANVGKLKAANGQVSKIVAEGGRGKGMAAAAIIGAAAILTMRRDKEEDNARIARAHQERAMKDSY